MRRSLWSLFVVASVLILPTTSFSMGILLPNGEGSAPLAIESHRVTINVTDSAAVTHIDQVFRNSSGRQLEATFIFPVPDGATVSDFALYINGVRTQGEVLESTQARQVYNNIVRQIQDPGLVEYVDGRLFQASIFPVPANGTQRVELEFAQVLERNGDLLELVYPLRTGRTSATTLQDFTIAANITSTTPLRTIYSPSHDVDVVRQSNNRAVVGLEQHAANLEQDFVLYLSTSEDRIGMDLMTFDSDGSDGQDGYFLMVVAPRLEDEGEIPAKDVTFVVDTSGSMAGEKIEQAQETLRYCVSRLRPQDRFNIVRFSTASRPLFEGLTSASPENISRANAFIAEIRAAGGTAIEDALSRALQQEADSGRPHQVIFITDGLPTVGETDSQRLIQTLNGTNQANARVFTFGVGYDVDTTLLDSLANNNHGTSDYVRPNENMEMAVSNLYDRIAFPVLTDIDLRMNGVDAYDLFPQEVPDLFAGQQVVLTGRFRNNSRSQIALAGSFSGQSVAFNYSEDFGSASAGANDFIPQLWATRKIGFLVDQIRLNGETAELRNEVQNLGVRYGLVTPYTSYLAVDDSEFGQMPQQQAFLDTPAADEDASGWGARTRRSSRERDNNFAPEEESASAAEPAPIVAIPMASAQGSFNVGSTGESSVEAAEEAQRLSEQEFADGRTAVRQIGNQRFSQDGDGVWRSEQARNQSSATRVNIRYMSEAYFRLLEIRPDVARLIALGEQVEFQVNSVIVVIDSSGMERMDAATEALVE